MLESSPHRQQMLNLIVESMTRDQVESYLRIARRAAINQMKKMGKTSVDGKGGDDYASEGFTYIASRGQSFDFLSRRTQLLVIDGYRKQHGRKGRAKKPQVISSHELLRHHQSNVKVDNSFLREFPDAFRGMCEALLAGCSRREASLAAGICPTKFRQWASKEAWRIQENADFSELST